MTKPITPTEVIRTRMVTIPSEVIDAFNEMIVQKWDGKEAYFKLKEISSIVSKKLKEKGSKEKVGKLIEKGCFDVEDIYRKEGWTVMFEQPSWDENFDSYFLFSIDKNT